MAINLRNEIYSILEDYETWGVDLYDPGAPHAIIDYLNSHSIKYSIDYINNKNDTAVCGISFADPQYQPQLIMFTIKVR